MTTATDPATQLHNLSTLPDDSFRTLIENNLDRDEHPSLWDLLLHPQMVRRTHAALGSAFRDVEDQLAERRADLESFRQECHQAGPAGKDKWFAAQGEHQEWRRRAIGYRRILQRRLSEAKNALNNAAALPSPQPAPANSARKTRQVTTVFRLAWVISQHRDETLRQGIVPDEHDVELWRALDLIELDTTDGPITITEFLDDVTSKPGFTPPDLPAGGRS
ncbi:hypothetical protein E1287_07190 [Actinomadura sp. KC06]|uniref:hypothetical protein n=1 Tax=Actinomadura sp. KC06 TaxID=2530369 RepID=UPI00104F9BF2|nr:hypothetical protein [Actinomadura sp. KC06]TDD37836.1 hypothetical protein E1287_07190 [Actinomadura sp. KC06]